MGKRKSKYNMKRTVTIPNVLINVIIPVYGRFDLLKQCLDCIPDAMDGLTYTITLFDNGSPDQTEADKFYSAITNGDTYITRSKINLGFPKACNLGSRGGNAPILFFLNSDVFLKPNSVRTLVLAMDDPKIGVVGMKLIFPEETPGVTQNNNVRPAGKIQHIGLATNIRGEWIHIYLGWDTNHPKINKVKEVYAVTGAALMTRRNLWKKAGGFFEGYGGGSYEDCDFCLTVRDMGYNVIVVPEAEATHFAGGSAEAYKIGFTLNNNRMTFLQRWGNKLNYTQLWHG